MVGINLNMFEFTTIHNDINLVFPLCYDNSISLQQPQQKKLWFEIEIQKLKINPIIERSGK